ncbi:hypothetical protein QUF50_00240 [Thiotrichales bacterium HSG1]|nr:hypothetical protein [Thiotrichales bacterium HSG1]
MKYLITILILVTTLSINAEIITDGTLSRNINLPGPNFKITPDLGQQHGGNLFHSFQDFNLSSTIHGLITRHKPLCKIALTIEIERIMP